MIIVRAPMRISFVGGGTDLPEFYTRYPGRVISAAIDKFVYVTVNRPPLLKDVSARYAVSEVVSHPSELKNDRIREALLDLGITSHIDVGSFSVALMKALLNSQGKKTDRGEIAELAARLEIQLVKEPIGKQDQYAAAFGGLNVLQFNQDHSVNVEPVYLDYKKQSALEGHIQLFYTGITRLASSVLTEQRANIATKVETLKKMADSVPDFRDALLAGDFEALGGMLHEGWLLKKTLASNVTNTAIDDIYNAGMSAGAWGGKVLGAGGGGCVMFLSPIEKKPAIHDAVMAVARKHNLKEFAEIPIRLVQSGVEVLINHDQEGNCPTFI